MLRLQELLVAGAGGDLFAQVGQLGGVVGFDFGVPLVTAGTFGSIILHIEPSDLAGIQVPRFSPQFEGDVDALIKRSSKLRTDAVNLINESRGRFDTFGDGILQERLDRSALLFVRMPESKLFRYGFAHLQTKRFFWIELL